MRKLVILCKPQNYQQRGLEAARNAGVEAVVIDSYENARDAFAQAQAAGATHLLVQRRAFNNELEGIDHLAIPHGVNVILIGMGMMERYHNSITLGYDYNWQVSHLAALLTSDPSAAAIQRRIDHIEQKIAQAQLEKERLEQELKAFGLYTQE